MRKIEGLRARLGFPSCEPLSQKVLKETRESKNRAREKKRRGESGKLGIGEWKATVATPQDCEARGRLELERAREHVRQGTATIADKDLVRRHL